MEKDLVCLCVSNPVLPMALVYRSLVVLVLRYFGVYYILYVYVCSICVVYVSLKKESM